MIASRGNRCHECTDETRIRRNCGRPLRSSQFDDVRVSSDPKRCPVEGYRYDGSPDPRFSPRFISRYWRALDSADNWARCTPDQIPADVDVWVRTVRAMHSQAEAWAKEAVERKRKMIQAATKGGAGGS